MMQNEPTEHDNIIIVTGGTVNPELLKKLLASHRDAYIVGVDKGLEALHGLAVEPDLVVGDFDSADDGIRAIYANSPGAILLNTEKDLTDTHVAVLEAIKRLPKHIIIAGATGTRIDHMMGNLGLLKICLMHGIDAVIVDDNNRIRMIDRQLKIKKDRQYGRYISCIPFSDQVTGITIEGFKYDLQDATMIKEETIGISNELREEEGLITVGEGYLLVMETKD
ncbi:MAG: thiamine diphosphokinase [Wujia sp.]